MNLKTNHFLLTPKGLKPFEDKNTAILNTQATVQFFRFRFILMHIFKVILITKPFHYLITYEPGGLIRWAGQVTAPAISKRMDTKTMMDWVVVDINQNTGQVNRVINQLTFKRTFKQVAMAVVAFVEGLCIGIKQVRKSWCGGFKPDRSGEPTSIGFRTLSGFMKIQYLDRLLFISFTLAKLGSIIKII
jgi:hypothetical protein